MLLAGREFHCGALWPKNPRRAPKLKAPASGATGLVAGWALAVMACTSCWPLQPWMAIMACSSPSCQALPLKVVLMLPLVKGTL